MPNTAEAQERDGRGLQFFGDRLAGLRKKAGLTQRALAENIGVAVNSIQNYESGKTPSGDVLCRLASVLGCSIDWLLTGVHPAPPAPKSICPELDLERLRDAIEAVEEGLASIRQTLRPEKKAELIVAAYSLMHTETEAKGSIVTLLRAVV